jgi:hypothetical protein
LNGTDILRKPTGVKTNFMEKEIIAEMTKLLEKTGVGTLTSLTDAENPEMLETFWMNVKAMNACFDKGEALTQVQWLMNKYNIQIDELMERIS